MVPSVLHVGDVEFTERDALAHSTVQEGIREESITLGVGREAGHHLQVIQRLLAPPVDGELLPIPGAGDIEGA